MADKSFILGIHDANKLIESDSQLAENIRLQMAIERIIKCRESNIN
jgi:hypothetical protein